jgi:hypothetical protein
MQLKMTNKWTLYFLIFELIWNEPDPDPRPKLCMFWKNSHAHLPLSLHRTDLTHSHSIASACMQIAEMNKDSPPPHTARRCFWHRNPWKLWMVFRNPENDPLLYYTKHRITLNYIPKEIYVYYVIPPQTTIHVISSRCHDALKSLRRLLKQRGYPDKGWEAHTTYDNNYFDHN